MVWANDLVADGYRGRHNKVNAIMLHSFNSDGDSVLRFGDFLNFSILLLKLSLDFKVQLAFLFYALLFHVSHDSNMHGLRQLVDT